MLISKLNPFIRYARFLTLTNTSTFEMVTSLDNRLFYTCNGFGKIKVNEIEYEMSEGSLLLIRAGNPYHILSPSENITYIAINFDFTQQAVSHTRPIIPAAATDFSKDMLVENTDIFDGVFYKQNFSILYQKLSSIVKEYSTKLLYYEQKTSCLFTECIIECMRNAANGSSTSENEIMAKLIAFIQKNYHRPLNNRIIGEYLGYHPNYISYLTKKFTCMPLHQYILHLRLSHAMSLLENSNRSIDEIAVWCGFLNSAHFSKCFKKAFHTLPSKCRDI